MKNRLDAFAEIEKHEYTYNLNGEIVMIKKPKQTDVIPEYDLKGLDNSSLDQSSKKSIILKGKTSKIPI